VSLYDRSRLLWPTENETIPTFFAALHWHSHCVSLVTAMGNLGTVPSTLLRDKDRPTTSIHDNTGILRKNSGIPKIGDKKSAHQARFHSSHINRSPDSGFSDYRQIWIIRTHPNSSESPNSVIRVTRITEYEYSVIRVTRITEYSVIWFTRIKPNLAINLEVRYGTCLMPLWPSHHLIN
jgi:hypothetical protein